MKLNPIHWLFDNNRSVKPPVLLAVTPPRTGERTLLGVENLFQSIAVPEPFSLEIVGDEGGVILMARCRDQEVVRGQIAAHYPQARIHEIPEEEDPLRLGEGEEAWSMTLRSGGPEYVPLRVFRDDDLLDPGSDPLIALLGALSSLNMDERQSIRKIAVLVGGGLKPLRISDKAEAPQGPLPRHESTRNRLPGPCGVCRSLSSRLPAVRYSFVERGALHGNCRADSCGREDVRVLRGPALGGLHAGRKAQGLEAHPVRPVVLAVREGDPAGAAGRERVDQRIMCPTCHPTIGDGDDFTASNG